jgi:hypothetical protein
MRLDTLWMGKKSVDQQVADRGNGLQSTKTRDTGDRIVPVMRANCYWSNKDYDSLRSNCTVSAPLLSLTHYDST